MSAINTLKLLVLAMFITGYGWYSAASERASERARVELRFNTELALMDFNSTLDSVVYHSRNKPDDEPLDSNTVKLLLDRCNDIQSSLKTNIDTALNHALYGVQSFCKNTTYKSTYLEVKSAIKNDVRKRFDTYRKANLMI